MPIDGTQVLDPNDLDYGLPVDTCCVGEGGPTPTETTTISKSAGKSPVQTGGSIPVGYAGP